MDIINVFTSLGLKEDHLKIYKASLEWGETTISNLAYKSKVPRTTVYEQLDDLIKLGIIKQSLREGKKLYFPENPEFLMALLDRKQNELQELMSNFNSKISELKAMQNTNKNKPKIHFLEGADGIKQAYEMTFNTKEVLVQCLAEDYGDVEEKFFHDYFNRFFLESNVKSKEILAENEDDDYLKKYGSGKNLQLRVPVKGDLSTDFMVFDNTVIFVSFDTKNSYALVVEDPKVASCMRNLFNLAWESASRTDKRILRGEKVLTEYKD
ncbi:MAG TPA: helix-turn-helix domain-containing protein [Candidatus Dojkabacteria bacterium]|nr:helix-turn-helix domain-containing protein [Candidatus Dojkabacteria bacterium]